MNSFLKNCRHNWRLFFILCYPIILIPIPYFVNTLAGYTAYSIIVVSGLWLTEAVPSPVAGMLPIILHPLFGIQSTEQVAKEYMRDAAMVFIGGYLLSLAFEFCGLHKRMALKVMLWSGTSLTTLLMGIMLTTMFLSMWMFNAAAAAMMVPIVLAVLDELKGAGVLRCRSDSSGNSRNTARNSISRRFSVSETTFEEISAHISEEPPTELEDMKRKPKVENKSGLKMNNLKTMFLLGISYSANLGGTGVLTGTGPNLIALDYLGNLDPAIHGDHASLTFTTWMVFACVPMMINIVIAWIYLQLIFIGIPEQLKFWKNREVNPNAAAEQNLKIKIKRRMQEKYDQLGPLSSHEIGVTIHFLCTATFWAFHNPKVIPGWSEFFLRRIHISTGTILTGILLFIIPRDGEFYKSILTGKISKNKVKPLLEWEFTKKGMPWGVFLLLGGGLALSSASVSSGLSASIVQSLHSLIHLPPYGIQAACLLVTIVLTEMMSNTAVATLSIPILLELSINLKIHPLYITFPASIACSYAFMLPVATGPNLIVFNASGMKLFDMVKAGIFMSLISVFILCLCANYYGEVLFHFSEYKILTSNSSYT